MRSADDLRQVLSRIDGRGYKAYKAIGGAYELGDLSLHVDHVQGDPFAAPSRVRVRVPWSEAGLPAWSVGGEARRVATADFLTRAFAAAVEQRAGSVRGSGKSGLVAIETPAQEVLPRTSVVLEPDEAVEARIVVGLPAQGRRVLGRQARTLLLEEVPEAARRSLRMTSLDGEALRRHVEAVEDQRALRDALAEHGLVAFVGDGAALPRRSGVDPRPMQGRVVPIEAPEELAVEIVLPNRGRVRGLGLRRGVTLIVGGGYHGKSTLLDALQLGVYDHVPGDGRELVAACPDAVKIRAEDGRRVENVDISPFIRNLPFGRDTRAFRSDDASGSTSQAANIMEALEAGAEVLLIDEDTSATNFMIRDHRMQALVAKDKEPITPFIDEVRHLWRDRGVSSVIVVGGAGDYFDVADSVIMMDAYRPHDVTERARTIAERYRELRRPEGGSGFPPPRPRRPRAASLDPSRGKRDVKVDARGTGAITFGRHEIDLSAVEQLVECAQTRAIAAALVYLRARLLDGRALPEALDALERVIAERGLDAIARWRAGDLAAFRRHELAAALNRLRTLRADAETEPGE